MTNIALQMYSLREYLDADVAETLKKVAACGFYGVEFAGYYDLSKEAMKKALDEAGLKAVSSHIPLDRLLHNLDEEIEYNLYLGNHEAVCPFAPLQTREDALKLAEDLAPVAEACKKAGLRLSYHNHSHEFAVDGGATLWKTLLDNCPALYAQLDCFWAACADVDPIQAIGEYANRISMIHVKELGQGADKPNVVVGEGILDWKDIFAVAKAQGATEFIIEQEGFPREPYECLKTGVSHIINL